MVMTRRIYGNLPKVVGHFDLDPKEMMFWLYCPVKIPALATYIIPSNLEQYKPLLLAVEKDLSLISFTYQYVCITAKTLYVTPEAPGNRPGWHSDGFLSADINYIWYDSNPTIFYAGSGYESFSADHQKSLDEMHELCEEDTSKHVVYPNKTLLRLDQTVLHKVDTAITAGMRTFVKISVSTDRYGLEGNSVNHALAKEFGIEYTKRGATRNDPARTTAEPILDLTPKPWKGTKS